MTSPPPEPPLTPAEQTRLRRWQRWMIASFVITMSGLVLIVLVPLPEPLRFRLWIAVVALALFSAGLQFSRCCPRCGANIGTQSRLVLPANCHRCGVALRQ